MSFSLTGKTAIVTGSAAGIGLSIARHFLAKGANVMFADVDEVRLENECSVEARAEGALRYFGGDLREKLTINNLLSATIDAFDRVDILVNASRKMVPSDPLNPDEDAVEQMWQQNLLTSLRLSQMTAKRMILQAEKQAETSGEPDGVIGSIINLSSIAARHTQPQLLGYSISCAAVEQMTRSLSVALAPHRIRVNAVSFGSVLSDSLQAAIKENPDYRDAITAATPLGRIAAADELAETVQYLASDASAFMTGQIITLDGGRGLIDAVNAPAH
ncbi:7-alpha-hydroxysteroid dehydrogenase [Pseudorhodobacter antarcticus]|uniref:7-alpha-hydroxysteroid dehydrogenase n=1 Tax=Pseudorhodobacter antarcticus TaxID=1077947 RepID=A0A1H8F2X0_9RHOB|nr:SDR family oxidoreductase [Pseudorhodobacter antarcticus]SEN26082.1 7-alpha-hydroxysteroid dehydrogenase [Pseudorhodobacter antarcticus]